ncbi:DUF5809 family protein [Natronobeatus ordinarius]|uniref:DUF5809 family protein n=1 Tax=Natronobeatus ordinarius TaxID=2963433 RepID=UPI0020CCC108|nr:DUF5809 family protein [Natronobeatus ordinarius]
MHTVGTFDPESLEEAREQYESVAPAAGTVVREVARAMEFDREEFGDRVTEDVIETAHDALFASLLAVTVSTREEYDDWIEGYDGDVTEVGHDHAANVVWHAGPEDEAVAATFNDQEEAAVATLRRQAFGRIYRARF